VVSVVVLALQFAVVSHLLHLPHLLLILLLLQERANPQLLISSPSRRRRVAEGSGRSEQDVAELMGAFTQMKAQTSQMSKIMKLGQGKRSGTSNSAYAWLVLWLSTNQDHEAGPGEGRQWVMVVCRRQLICVVVDIMCGFLVAYDQSRSRS
jgi:hypothetical protein